MIVLLLGVSLPIHAKFQTFSRDLGDNALRLAIDHFNKDHKNPLVYFSGQHLFMVELLKQLDKVISLTDYPIYNAEDHYKLLSHISSDRESFEEVEKNLREAMGDCPREQQTILSSNNYSPSASGARSDISILRPFVFGSPGKCHGEVLDFFKQHHLLEVVIKRSRLPLGQWVGEIHVVTRFPQDLEHVRLSMAAWDHFSHLSEVLVPKPLSRQHFYYENHLRAITPDGPVTTKTPVRIILETRKQEGGVLTITRKLIEARLVDEGPFFKFSVSDI